MAKLYSTFTSATRPAPIDLARFRVTHWRSSPGVSEVVLRARSLQYALDALTVADEPEVVGIVRRYVFWSDGSWSPRVRKVRGELKVSNSLTACERPE